MENSSRSASISDRPAWPSTWPGEGAGSGRHSDVALFRGSNILVLSATTMTPSIRPYLLVAADCKDERAILEEMLFRKNWFVARQHGCLSPGLTSMLRERRDQSIL
jgi:hypothetical protein